MADLAHVNPDAGLHVPSNPEAAALGVKASSTPGFSSTQASVLLDVLRALAAIFVLLEHVRNLFFVDYTQIPLHRALFAVPWVLCSAGHQSVVVFFVLSGYLISGSIFRMFQKHAWSWKTYLLHRGVRLWIVLLPGLVLAALWDSIGLHLRSANAVTLYSGFSGDHMIFENIATHVSLLTWLGNLAFLQVSFVPVFGTDGVLWSLANEFWYYILFPLAFIACRPATRLVTRLVSIALIAAIVPFLAREILYMFPIWLLGTLLAVLPVAHFSRAWRIVASVLYAPAIFFFAKLQTTHDVLKDLAFGVLTFVYVYILLSARGPAREQARSTRTWRTLARFSYTLYVVHLPPMVLIAALVLPATRWLPDAPHLAIGAGLLVLALAYSYGLAAVTEFRTDKLRRTIERRLT